MFLCACCLDPMSTQVTCVSGYEGHQCFHSPSHQARLEAEMVELRGRVSTLQHDLDNSETVQRDFVRLSQSLQVQLEKIRQSEKEVSLLELSIFLLSQKGG